MDGPKERRAGLVALLLMVALIAAALAYWLLGSGPASDAGTLVASPARLGDSSARPSESSAPPARDELPVLDHRPVEGAAAAPVSTATADARTSPGDLAGGAGDESRPGDAGADAPSPAAAGGMSISGTVLLAAGGRPLTGARVQLLFEVEGELEPGDQVFWLESLPSATTDDRGFFVVEPISEPRDWALWITHADAAPRVCRRIRVLPAQRTEVGDIVLEAGASVWGTVVDDDGRPLARHCVHVGGRADRIEAWTSELGEYVLAGLPPGEHVLAVEPHHETSGFDPALRRPITVRPGMSLRVDFRVRTRTGAALEASVEGAGAIVYLVREDLPGGHAGIRCEPQPDGTFRVQGLPPGPYAARVHFDVLCFVRRFAVPESASAMRLDLAAPQGTVCGRVLLPDGSPAKRPDLPGAQVRLVPLRDAPDATGFEAVERAWPVDDEGIFRMDHVLAGDYRLDVRFGGYRFAEDRIVTVHRSAATGPIEVVLVGAGD